jgi:hypothetical protein
MTLWVQYSRQRIKRKQYQPIIAVTLLHYYYQRVRDRLPLDVTL